VSDELRQAVAAFNAACARFLVRGGTQEKPTPERLTLLSELCRAYVEVTAAWHLKGPQL